MYSFARFSIILILTFVVVGCSFPEPKALGVVFDSKPQPPDQPQVIKDSMNPYYPPEAILAGTEGLVLVFSLIDKEGLVRKVQIAKSSGHLVLDEAALASAAQFRYVPAKDKIGNAQSVVVKVPILYRIKLPNDITSNPAIQNN
jgi:TonB family protein